MKLSRKGGTAASVRFKKTQITSKKPGDQQSRAGKEASQSGQEPEPSVFLLSDPQTMAQGGCLSSSCSISIPTN
jgi:hypothetical protein